MTDNSVASLPLSKLELDERFQMRESLDNLVVSEYSWNFGALGPIDVFTDGQGPFYVVDGFHRVAAAFSLGLPDIRCRIHEGNERDAMLFALQANTRHGLRRSNADKRKAVTRMLADDEWRLWSDNKIAQHCGVSQPYVSSIRKELTVASAAPKTRVDSTMLPPPDFEALPHTRKVADEMVHEETDVSGIDHARIKVVTCPTCKGAGQLEEAIHE